MSSPCACSQIETGSGDKQSNVSLVSREDFERLKNLTQSSSSITQTQSTVPEDDIEVCFQHKYLKRLRVSCLKLQWSKRPNNFFPQKKIAALSETVESEEAAEAQTLEMTPSKRSQRGSESRRGKEAARFYPVTKEPGQHGDKESDKRKRKTSHSDNPPVENHVGWIMDKKAARERLESVTESLGESPECSGDDRGSSAGTTPQVSFTILSGCNVISK